MEFVNVPYVFLSSIGQVGSVGTPDWILSPGGWWGTFGPKDLRNLLEKKPRSEVRISNFNVIFRHQKKLWNRIPKGFEMC